MAKTISKMQKRGAKDIVKLIISEKSPKTGKYSFKEKIISKEMLNDALKK
jgi:hypothetical protein